MMLTSMESVIRRDRRIIVFSIVGITVLAWNYLIMMAGDVMVMAEAMTGPRTVSWTAVDFTMAFIMWAAMMVGMMLPTASPMVLMFAKVNRNQCNEGKPVVATGIFVAGYVAIWLVFALVAALLQWSLQMIGLLASAMGTANVVFGGIIMIVVGMYQWTPYKDACLRLCQTPLGFLMTRWRDGIGGAFRMGLSHGVYCVGCCWALMLLMYVGGIMNLLWMAALAVLMLAEKITPPNSWLPRIVGVMLVTWGGWVLGVAI